MRFECLDSHSYLIFLSSKIVCFTSKLHLRLESESLHECARMCCSVSSLDEFAEHFLLFLLLPSVLAIFDEYYLYLARLLNFVR